MPYEAIQLSHYILEKWCSIIIVIETITIKEYNKMGILNCSGGYEKKSVTNFFERKVQ